MSEEHAPRVADPARPSAVTWAVLLGLLAVGLVLPFHRLDERDLWSSHEGRAAMDARSLLEPQPGQPAGLPWMDDGRPELQKPPAFYWAVAAVARLRGGPVDAWAVRLPAALSAVGVALAVGLALALGFGRPLAGAIAALTLVTGIHFPWLARIGRIDMPLTLTVSLAALAFALALRCGRFRPAWLLVAYLACAAGVMLKGPIGLVLPGAIVAATLLERGRWPAVWEGRAWVRLLTELHVVPGLLIVAAVVVPIFLWLESVTGGQFGREFLWYHNVTRGLGGSRLRGHPPWQHAFYFLLYFLPFTPLVLLGFCRGAWRDDWAARFGLAWLVGVVVILSVARFKRADYLAPAYPGAALFLGCLCERCVVSRRGVLILGALAIVGWGVHQAVVLPGEEAFRDYRAFARRVRAEVPAPGEVLFFRTEAHALAFHVGRPLARFVEYAELRSRLNRPGVHHLVLPPAVLDEVRRQLPGCNLVEVARNTGPTGRHERPLVLVRASHRGVKTGENSDHARDGKTAADLPRVDQRRPVGP